MNIDDNDDIINHTDTLHIDNDHNDNPNLLEGAGWMWQDFLRFSPPSSLEVKKSNTVQDINFINNDDDNNGNDNGNDNGKIYIFYYSVYIYIYIHI